MNATEEQFAEFLTKYEKLVYTLCYRMSGNPFDAQDLTQDTFLSAYQRLSEFAPMSGPGYAGLQRTNVWIF